MDVKIPRRHPRGRLPACAPRPAFYSGGTTKKAGSGCDGCESTCKVGSSPTAAAPSGKGVSDVGSGGGAAPVPDTQNPCTVAALATAAGMSIRDAPSVRAATLARLFPRRTTRNALLLHRKQGVGL
ncbi:hypothetical protein VTK56DRAFT_5245 [Thermocarpiscus australiensis]